MGRHIPNDNGNQFPTNFIYGFGVRVMKYRITFKREFKKIP